MIKWWEHLKTINHHKYLVMKHCFRIGLYRQGLLHDLSKYSPIEFSAGARYFQGNRSPNEIQRQEIGYSAAWLHHKGRNKHHLEYWIDYSPSPGHKMEGMKMPYRYVAEMVCDRIAASKNYRKELYQDRDPYDYFDHSRSHYIIHPETSKILEEHLILLKDQGENALFSFMKEEIKRRKKDGSFYI